MQIRNLAPADAAEFHALRLRGLRECPGAFASSYEEECDDPPAAIAGRLAPDPNRAVLGAFSGATLAGVIGLQREGLRKLCHKAFLWGVYVAPEFRHQGVARQLVDRALRAAFAMRGVRQVNLGVNVSNVPAVALYEAAGFIPFGVERGFMIVDGAPQDEIHMVRVTDKT